MMCRCRQRSSIYIGCRYVVSKSAKFVKYKHATCEKFGVTFARWRLLVMNLVGHACSKEERRRRRSVEKRRRARARVFGSFVLQRRKRGGASGRKKTLREVKRRSEARKEEGKKKERLQLARFSSLFYFLFFPCNICLCYVHVLARYAHMLDQWTGHQIANAD